MILVDQRWSARGRPSPATLRPCRRYRSARRPAWWSVRLEWQKAPARRRGAREWNTSSSPICRTLASFLATSYWRNNARSAMDAAHSTESLTSGVRFLLDRGDRSRFTLYRQMHKGGGPHGRSEHRTAKGYSTRGAAGDDWRRRWTRIRGCVRMSEIKIGVLQPLSGPDGGRGTAPAQRHGDRARHGQRARRHRRQEAGAGSSRTPRRDCRHQ